MVSYLLLGIIGILALSMKEYALAIAASTVGILLAMGQKATLHAMQQYAFPIGIFFLMFFLLVPVTSGKVSSDHIMKVLTSPIGWGSILAGFIVSCIGGKGVGVLPMSPTILVGVLIGTLLAVLFAKGLPAGLLIAAGIIAIISMK
ncbi:DUF441 family protein [Bacillus thuringiensis]|uniref:DUF441 family protein n=1 Tax=Bacillus thuringiensis TaxID=1428 RepID=UPI00119D99A8|nr:DUF441 family protein [Bacillus thuringiensis]